MKRRKTPIHRRRLRTLLNLLTCVFCAMVFWMLIGMPTPSAEHVLRQLERRNFLESGEILATISDDRYVFQPVRGTDGVVRVSCLRRYDKAPILYESYNGGWMTCDSLEGMTYFAGFNPTEYAYVIVADERAKKVVMDVTFTLDDREHAQTMHGVLLENGVFRLDLNEMLNLAQGKVYDSGDSMTYDWLWYWLAFPGGNGLCAFDSYTIRAFDTSGNELHCWSKPAD